MTNNNLNDLNLYKSPQKNINTVKQIFKNDGVLRTRYLNSEALGKCALVFMDGMVNNELLSDSVIKPLTVCEKQKDCRSSCDFAANNLLFAAELSKTDTFRDIVNAVVYGDTAIFFENDEHALIINTKGWRTRGISEPPNEQVLQGPREGFDESVMLNAAMLRRKLQTSDFRTEFLKVGKQTETKMFLCYITSVANEKTVNEIRNRIKNISIDGVLDSNYISELINRGGKGIFKTVGTTERPDIVAARLLEGRIALLVDGTPVALTVPYLFSENFQADDDYYLNSVYSTIGRILRYISFFAAISVPALYVAITVYHPYLLPTSFITTLCDARSCVPLPSFAECLLLVFVFEILRETGIRMPQSMGHALSIVGGLVVGQAAAEAKIVSSPMLITVALSGICGLMIPRLKAACFYLRILLILLGATLGLYGYFLGITFVLIKILGLTSFGTDCTSALCRINFQSFKDVFVRTRWENMILRPATLTKNIKRQNEK